MEGRKSSNDLDFHTVQPLSRRILDESIPSRFKMQQMEPYDASTNPIDHLESYKAFIMIQEVTDTLLCIGFSIIIQKAARPWYSELQLESINSFE